MINQYITFFTQHWILSALFIFTLVVIIIYEMFNKVLSTKSVAPQETVQLMNRQNGIVIDIRDQDSFKKEHIAQAINVPLSKLKSC